MRGVKESQEEILKEWHDSVAYKYEHQIQLKPFAKEYLDYLKKINDIHGHYYGDLAIKTIADVLKKSCRSIDIAARMGGEEFNLLLPGVDHEGGMIAAERIRKAIEEIEIEIEEERINKYLKI